MRAVMRPRLSDTQQRIVVTVRVRAIRPNERARCLQLLEKHHYLGAEHARPALRVITSRRPSLKTARE